MRLREAITNGVIGETAKTFLQNLQDARSNCLRLAVQKDDLQRSTEPLKPGTEDARRRPDHDIDDNEEGETLEGQQLEELLSLLQHEAVQFGTIAATPIGMLPWSLSLKAVRQKGRLNCGYECLARMNTRNQQSNDPVIEVELSAAQNHQQSASHPIISDSQHRKNQIERTLSTFSYLEPLDAAERLSKLQKTQNLSVFCKRMGLSRVLSTGHIKPS
jgi:hypothetical protein